MKKVLKVSGIIFGILLFLVASFLAVWFWWPWHSEFYENAHLLGAGLAFHRL